MKWPDVEVELKNWIAENRSSRILVVRRVILLKDGGWLHTASLLGHFLGKGGEDYLSFKKLEICNNALDGAEDAVVFEESASSVSVFLIMTAVVKILQESMTS